MQIDSVKELQNAREAPDLLLWKLAKAQAAWLWTHAAGFEIWGLAVFMDVFGASSV